ncbi:NUDIX hydrolase [Actibacterium lipolyticum]|uniref:RNA pyrophosphohydrolase n=1 Tax=Actibacterium lipolyticum TaxID=1524263 RepID=A0A238KWL5_9RHOB|nr:NUDIX hydrolase [Actibacterium lipolyticum]SMX47030.1 RNA pyrophosphohydrolase [Actibacterium lipolyticum]
MIRRFGGTVESGRKYKLRHGVYAILPLKSSLLVTYQNAPVPEFQLPGGGIDPGESPLAALHREVFEETGWRVAPVRRLGAFRRFTFMPDYDIWAEKMCHIYLARPIRPHGPPTEPGHTAVFLPMEQAADQLGNSGDRHFVSTFCKQV